MALNPEDLGSGFRHSKVSMYINEQMAKHDKGPDFYLENLSLTWEEVEDKLKVILEDSEVPSDAREACAWGTLALGVRFAHRQGCLQGHGVQWLQDLSRMHKVATISLSSDLKPLTHQQEIERREVTLQLQLAKAKLEEVQRERDLLRLKILQAVRLSPGPVLALPIPPLCQYPIPRTDLNLMLFSPGAEGSPSCSKTGCDHSFFCGQKRRDRDTMVSCKGRLGRVDGCCYWKKRRSSRDSSSCPSRDNNWP
ncbi:testis expressed 13A [Cricetulus griseus]